MSESNATTMYSTMVRAGRTTYFIDVRESKNGRKFIAIAESRMGERERKERSTIRVFGESIEQFRQAVNEAAASLMQ